MYSCTQCSRDVIREAVQLWDKARIPIQPEHRTVLKLEKLHEKWIKLKKNAKRETETQKEKETEFIEDLDNLFDIAHMNALNLIKIKEDREFLVAQREKGRRGCLGSLDMALALNESRPAKRRRASLERKQREEQHFEKLNEEAVLESSSSGSDDDKSNTDGPTMTLVMRSFPVMRYDCDFFEKIKQQMNLEFKQIDDEIEKMRRQMLHLLPMDPVDVMVQEIKPSIPIVEEKGETKLKLEFNVKEFRPEDLEVKLLGNNILQVTAHREDRNESGMSRICYLRKYSLPEGIDREHIKPTLTKDGVLTIEAPAPALKQKERMIPIEYNVQ